MSDEISLMALPFALRICPSLLLLLPVGMHLQPSVRPAGLASFNRTAAQRRAW